MGTVLILNNENFKVKVEQTNFVTHLIITAVQDPDLEIRWGAVSKKNFSSLRASVWSATVQYNYIIEYLRTCLLKSNGND